MNKDKKVLLFFRLRTSKTCLTVLPRNCIRLLIWSKVFLAWPVESVAPLEIKFLLQSRFPPNFYIQPNMLHCIKLTAAWNNDLSRLLMISFKQSKTLFGSSCTEQFPLPTMVKFENTRKPKELSLRTKRIITGIYYYYKPIHYYYKPRKMKIQRC